MKILNAMYIDDAQGNHQGIQVAWIHEPLPGAPPEDPTTASLPLNGSGWMNHELTAWLEIPGNEIAAYTPPAD